MDIDYSAVFDLGAEEQEVADPDDTDAAGDETGEEGAEEQEVADPAEEPEEEDEDAESAADEREPETPEDKSGAAQSKEERARQAAARRKAELDAEVARAKREERDAAKAEVNALIKKLALPNPLADGKVIETVEELGEYEKNLAARRLEANLKAGKLTEEDLAAAIERTEPMKRLSRAAAEEEQERARQKIESDLAAITKLNPAIKTVEDLTKMPGADKFYDYVRKGVSFEEAYYLTHRDELQSSTQAKAAQRAINNARSKNHLQPTGSRGAGAKPVPAEVMEMYRELMPDASEAEIRAHYNKSQKK